MLQRAPGGREAYIWPKIHWKLGEFGFYEVVSLACSPTVIVFAVSELYCHEKMSFSRSGGNYLQQGYEYHKKFIHLSANLQSLIVIATRRAHTIHTQQNRSSRFKSQKHSFPLYGRQISFRLRFLLMNFWILVSLLAKYFIQIFLFSLIFHTYIFSLGCHSRSSRAGHSESSKKTA